MAPATLAATEQSATAQPAAPVLPTPTAAPPAETPVQEAMNMQIRLRVGDTEIMATLNDSHTARDFISLLPLTLTLEDYARTEKIGYLPRKLSTAGAPAGSDPAVGDIAYYAPWGNLALFYRDSGYANGLLILGKLDSGVEALNVSDPATVTIELVSE
jgi:hypothetical protein